MAWRVLGVAAPLLVPSPSGSWIGDSAPLATSLEAAVATPSCFEQAMQVSIWTMQRKRASAYGIGEEQCWKERRRAN